MSEEKEMYISDTIKKRYSRLKNKVKKGGSLFLVERSEIEFLEKHFPEVIKGAKKTIEN